MTFSIPQKTILTKLDLENFQGSAAKASLVEFIVKLANSVTGKTLSEEVEVSNSLQGVIDLLSKLKEVVSQNPPVVQKSRYGNPSFVNWFRDMTVELPSLLAQVAPSEAIPELSTYLMHSFGDVKRIDYGTGHEAHFLIFLYCLDKIGVVGNADYPALVLRVFWDYIKLMRELEITYWLEPAGSHGVWGLDDFHFLPFLFGSYQLSLHKYLTPKSIHNHEILDEFSRDYIYFSCIKFINQVKVGASLKWHSPMLNDISGAKSWSKIANGMIKMYEAEVLGKLPIMQHMLFGSLFSFVGSDPSLFRQAEDGHVHAFGQEFPECCGIRVPSALAASAANGSFRKPLPFD